ncbi:hypothetical protein [Streptomyces erythrochromogenes]|uniref:hypothetical protein n=1 Tax=Streptomyces erythrochromogenes TaxID=285574 RepID=UPI002251CC4E|nr:hypothetical protein [Streptomyces erythrochromogenes]MCX5587599.1 hypothetical protein [Streptomyces erythrochromogenes]
MTIRPDVVELLHAGLSDIAIARKLGVSAPCTVAPARRALGLSKHKPGPARTPSVDTFVDNHCEAIDGGHLRWTGYHSNGVPQIRWVGHPRVESVYRFMFRRRHGREPVGHARPGCGMPQCVAPAHIDDQPARERNRRAYTALFGGAL